MTSLGVLCLTFFIAFIIAALIYWWLYKLSPKGMGPNENTLMVVLWVVIWFSLYVFGKLLLENGWLQNL